MSRTRLAAVMSAAGSFVLLTVLVAAGAFDRIDRYGLYHLTPGGLPTDSPIPVVGHLFQYHGHHFDASQVVRLPGTIVASVMVLAIGCVVLWRRLEHRSVLVWLVAFWIANAIVLLGKATIDQPAIAKVKQGTFHDFISSYPSGHATRIVLLAALYATLWPRLRWLLCSWAIVASASLKIDGIHTLSEVIGGALLGTTIVLAIPFFEGSGAKATPVPGHRLGIPYLQ